MASSEAFLALYRTAQEALTNVRRHAAAERVEMRLDYAVDGTTLDRPGSLARRRLALTATCGYGLHWHARARRAARRPLERRSDRRRVRVELWAADEVIRVLIADDQRVGARGLA